MTLTNPGAITNSGSKQFTNQFATVAKINYNRALNDDEYQAYQNFTWYAIHRRKHVPYCVECSSSKNSDHKHKRHREDRKEKKEEREDRKERRERRERRDKVHVKKDNYFVALFKKIFLR